MPGTVSYTNNEPVYVIYGTGNTNMGLCAEGDITVTIPSEWVPVTSHQTGGAAIEMYHKGGTPTIEMTFLEVNNWDLWEVVFPVAEKQRDAATPPQTRVAGMNIQDGFLGRWVGQRATTFAQRLTLRPERDYTSTSVEHVRDWFFPKALCTNVGAIPFGTDTPNAVQCTFTALFDTTATDGVHQWARGLRSPTAGAWIMA